MVNPILLIIIPLATAFFIPLLAIVWKNGSRYLALLAALANVLIGIKLLPYVLEKPIHVTIAGFKAPIGIDLLAGPLGIVFSLIISITGFLVLIYSIGYIRDESINKYYTLFLLLLTGSTGMVLTNDIFNLFVFFEILCISSYILVAYNRDEHGLEAAIKYLVLGSVGSLLFLIAIAIIYLKLGTLNMADISDKFDALGGSYRMMVVVLILSGLGVEAAIFPLNSWLPDAHSSAPSSISALLSGFVIEVALIVVMKLVYSVFHAMPVLNALAVVGVITLLVGEFAAFRQENIKRVLAYSSIGQVGLILLALSINSKAGISAAVLQIINHAASKSILFLVSGYFILKTGSYRYSDYSGIAKRMPVSSLLFVLAALSLIGVPPFLGFFSKLQIVMAAAARGSAFYVSLVSLVLLGTIVEGAYFLRIAQVLYFGRQQDTDSGWLETGNAAGIDMESVGNAPVSAVIPVLLLGLVVVFGFLFLTNLNGVTGSIAGEITRALSLASLF